MPPYKSGGNNHLKLIHTVGDGNVFGNSDGLKKSQETSLVVQWLGLHAFTSRGRVLIADLGTKILHVLQLSQN